MQHKEYWAERFEKLTEAQLNKGTEYYYNLQEQYRKAIANIEKDIAKWYTRYATENGITLTEAKRLLNGRELEEFRMDVKEYIAKGKSLDPKWAKQLEAASTKVHVSRLEALKVQMQQQAEMIYSYERDGIDELARSVYTDGYYHTAYEIQKGIGVGFDLMALDASRIDKLIAKPWAADGKNFSERIWNNRAQLVSELENRLTQSIIRGQSPKKVIAELAERFNVNKSRAGALVMTESAFFASASQRDAFNDLDVEKYEILATLDSRTSETCRIMDGKVIPMSDYKPGATAPPFHVRCYDKETEVYTNNGWKLFKDLTDADMVYTIDKDTLIPEWQKPLKIISYIHNGNLLHFVNDRTDLKVTPNHSLLVQNMDSSVKDRRYKLRTAESIGAKSKNRMLSGCKWIGETVETALLGGKEVDIETYLRFMAYWLADGSCTKDRTSYSIKIAQCNNDKMAAELSKLPFNVYKCKEALMIHNKELGAELSVYGKCADKFVPEFIKTLSPKLIKIFLEAYAATDGTTKKGKFWKGYQFADSVSFFTTSEKMAADLGELILKAGGRPSFSLQKHKGKEVTFKNGTYTLNYDLWVIFWNRQIHNWICYMNVTKEAYNDYVYCVEVEKHNTLLVRRNGKVVWCGNCRSTTVPHFDDEFTALDKRAARGEDGKYYTVPASMKYKDWEETFVKGGDKAGLPPIKILTNNGKSNIIKINSTQYAPVATIEEADNFLKTLGIDGGYKKGHINIDVANAVNKAVVDARGIFGNNLQLRSIGKYPKAQADFVAAYSPVFGDVYLYKCGAKDTMKRMAKTALENFSYGSWSTGSAEHFIRHELGHALHIGVGKKIRRAELEKIFNETRANIRWGKYGYTLNEYIKAGLRGADYIADLRAAGDILSAYGLTTVDEMVAEAVAEYMNGAPRDLAVKVVNTLMGW